MFHKDGRSVINWYKSLWRIGDLKEITLYREDKVEKKCKPRSVIGFVGAVLLVCMACAGASLMYLIFTDSGAVTVSENVDVEVLNTATVVIDAGHGGIDGGAVGADGSLEKDLNLSVAKRLEAICRLSGIDCVMTRTEDSMLADESMKQHRKMTDLKNRLAVVNGLEADGRSPILVSIHMNNFSSPEYSGLQVWFSPGNKGSAELASLLQDRAKNHLDSTNHRQIKKAGSSIYMLDRVTVPAVLVECGFLSNPEERERLKTEEYQLRLAAVIYSAICEYVRQ